jgi:hypothetical protein
MLVRSMNEMNSPMIAIGMMRPSTLATTRVSSAVGAASEGSGAGGC